ncbi:hypothetical protein [Teichococcus oryzae]|nr:hypothetical protein [Pseudoroseomonas oryzae]
MSDAALPSLPRGLAAGGPRPSFAKGLFIGLGLSVPLWGMIGLAARRIFF